MAESIILSTPGDFTRFPYKPPYSAQLQLMKHLYAAIEERRLVIAESPTGTGKTLSLLTSALTWLQDHEIRYKKGILASLQKSLSSDDDPEWVVTQTMCRIRDEAEHTEKEYEEHLANLRRKEKIMKERARVTKKPRLHKPTKRENEIEDGTFLPEEIDGKEESRKTDPDSEYSTYLCDDVQKNVTLRGKTKIFYASRTHSQLSQVIRELIKIEPENSPSTSVHNEEQMQKTVRAVTLASRQHLCINTHLRSQTSDLDEACRELLSGSQADRCPYLPPIDDELGLAGLRDHILATPKDIEDVVLVGRSMNLCPYFGTRAAVNLSKIVALPYNLLLHERSRETLGINLEDQIVIVDEAHNLIESILQLHTMQISTTVIDQAVRQLEAYFSRFRKRLSVRHALYIRRLIQFLATLNQFVLSRFSGDQRKAESSEALSVSSFVDSLGSKVNDINFLEIQAYLIKSKLALKVGNYVKNEDQDQDTPSKPTKHVLPLHAIEAFIACLVNSAEDGVVTMSDERQTSGAIYVKYQHLNPAVHFDKVLRSARCVILAGGTMSPISDVISQLFPTVPESKLSIFSCGHVIPASNLKSIVITKGPSGKELTFRYKDRSDESLLQELAQCLINIVNIVPNGLVVFLPSYAFLNTVRAKWSENGVLSRMQKKKRIYYEPSESSEVEGVLRDYSLSVSPVDGPVKGALLFAVVGAKLSEGLNFADELARAVVLVGIPYPSVASVELKERMKYVDNLAKKGDLPVVVPGRSAGNELYENLAMRAVNQSIGRAIRHKNDWASLILVDSRYSSEKVRGKLPGWINKDLYISQSFGQVMKSLGDFYRAKR